jgi:hypothetical protein
MIFEVILLRVYSCYIRRLRWCLYNPVSFLQLHKICPPIIPCLRVLYPSIIVQHVPSAAATCPEPYKLFPSIVLHVLKSVFTSRPSYPQFQKLNVKFHFVDNITERTFWSKSSQVNRNVYFLYLASLCLFLIMRTQGIFEISPFCILSSFVLKAAGCCTQL